MAIRTQVMGVINVTPDSFSDGGKWHTTEAAVARARQLIADGVDILDIGGESTRPNSDRVSEADEMSRVIPVITALADCGVPLSVDTMRASVAKAAVAAGASIVNDVSGGKADPEMFATVAELDVDYILMHWRGQSREMDALAIYDDVNSEAIAETLAQVELAQAAGICADRIIIDPGIGFAKNVEHNWAILRQLREWNQLGYRVLLGVSRKRFIGAMLSDAGRPADPADRDDATAAITGYAASLGIWAVRTHEVTANLAETLVWQRIRQVAE